MSGSCSDKSPVDKSLVWTGHFCGQATCVDRPPLGGYAMHGCGHTPRMWTHATCEGKPLVDRWGAKKYQKYHSTPQRQLHTMAGQTVSVTTSSFFLFLSLSLDFSRLEHHETTKWMTNSRPLYCTEIEITPTNVYLQLSFIKKTNC